MLDIEKLKSEDNAEYNKLYLLYKRKLLHLIYEYTHDNSIGEDLLQEVFIRVYKSISTYNPSYSFNTWIYNITINVAKSHMTRSEKFIPCGDFESIVDYSEEGYSLSKEDVANIVKSISYNDSDERYDIHFDIQNVVLSLPENLRRVTELIDIRGRSNREAAKILGLTEGTVRVLICRARKLIGEKSGTN
jgi:RNA polymerase sigma-70 factor (ECF subfamily)